MKNIYICFALLFAVSSLDAQIVESWKIDSIRVHKNWRTRDKIILQELQFSTGEIVDKNSLDKSIEQLWRIGNFAQVNYSVDSISPNSYLLNLTTKDAFNLVPYVIVSGNNDDKSISMGFSDGNFLGRNIKLHLSGNIGTYKSDYKVSVGVPRQLLYKNMTMNFQLGTGSANNYRYNANKKIAVVAYRSKHFSGSIGNPWHTDYAYTFSPNFSWNLFQHQTDTSLVTTDIPFADPYTIHFLSLSVDESIGLISRKRHQHDGYSVWGAYGIGIGLDKGSVTYHSFKVGAAYYKTFNPVIELSASCTSSYTTSTIPSLIHYMNSGDIKGITNGQESGQGNYNAKINCGFTYLYSNWFALEQSLYTHFGMAKNHYFEMYKQKPLFSVGTEFHFWAPMIPWLAASIHFTYMKSNNNWLHLDI